MSARSRIVCAASCGDRVGISGAPVAVVAVVAVVAGVAVVPVVLGVWFGLGGAVSDVLGWLTLGSGGDAGFLFDFPRRNASCIHSGTEGASSIRVS